MIREPHFHQFALAELLPFFEQFPTQYLSGEQNIKLAYRHLVQPESTVRKLMILVNGRAENMLKWTELAYDFYQQGYDVLLFDHRGQGYSAKFAAFHSSNFSSNTLPIGLGSPVNKVCKPLFSMI